MEPTVNKIIEHYDRLKAKRQAKSGLWGDIEKYCIPGALPFGADGYKTGQKPDVYDSEAFRASSILASGLYTSLTNPSSRWFEQYVSADYPMVVRDYVSRLTDFTREAFYSSNFYVAMPQFYNDLVHYGAGCLYVEASHTDIIRVATFNPRNFLFDVDQWGKVNFVIVEFKLSAAEAVATYGEENVSEQITRAIKTDPGKKFDFIQVVGSRDIAPFDVRGITKGLPAKTSEMPYYSFDIEVDKRHIVKRSGYKDFPFYVIIWQRFSNELYGSSPSINALPDVKMVNSMVRSFVEAAEMTTRPPLSLPYEGYLGDIDLRPGALNYRLTSDPKDMVQPIITSGNVAVTEKSILEWRERVRSAYFVDLFISDKETQMTATEVIQRAQERMLILGAVVGRLLHEFLSPLLKRVVRIIVDNGFFEPPPDGFSLDDIDIKYLSPLAKAQQSSEYNSLVILLNTALQIMQFDPDVADVVNWDEFIKRVGDLYAVTPLIYNDDEYIASVRKQRQQMQIAQASIEMAREASKADKEKAKAEETKAKAASLMGMLG